MIEDIQNFNLTYNVLNFDMPYILCEVLKIMNMIKILLSLFDKDKTI